MISQIVSPRTVLVQRGVDENSEKEEKKGWVEMQKSVLVEGSDSRAKFNYYKCKVGCYHRVLGVIKRNLKREGVMVSTNRKKGLRGATRRIRSRCDMNFVLRPIKRSGGAALRLDMLCVGWNREGARERGVS